MQAISEEPGLMEEMFDKNDTEFNSPPRRISSSGATPSGPKRKAKRGKCDNRCHTAEGPVCTCVCGGTWHGAKAGGPSGKQPELNEIWRNISEKFDRPASET